MPDVFGHRKCKSLVPTVNKETFDYHTHGIITRQGRAANVSGPTLLMTDKDGKIIASQTYDGDLIIGGNLTAALINGENYSEVIAALRDAIANATVSTVYKVTVSTTWQGSGLPYRQEIPLEGITEHDTPIVTLIKDGPNWAQVQGQVSNYNRIYRIVAQNGKIVLLAESPTVIEITLQVKVIR